MATCQKQFFGYLHGKMYVIIGIVFTLRAQGHLGVYDGGGGQEEEEEKKYSSGEVMSTFGPVYL